MLQKKQKIEYLSKDILDKQFIKSLRPMYIFQLILASSRVNIKDRFVTSPSLLQKLHTIITVIGIIILDVLTILKHNLILVDNSTIYFLSICVIILQTFTFICNAINVRFVKGSDNADFFVKLQQIDRCMKIDHNKILTGMMFKGNIFSILCVLIIFSTFLAAASTNPNISMLALLGIIYTQINLITEISLCSNIFVYFIVRARFMNSILFNYAHNMQAEHVLYLKNPCRTMFPTQKFLRQLAAETHTFMSSETDVYLKEILNGFAMFQTAFRFQIFIFCVKLVASCLLTFEFVLFAAQNDTVELADSLTPAVFTLIDIIVALILIIRSEIFLREIKRTKHLAITIMSFHFDGRLREKAKKMLKMIEEMPPRLSVYAMWELDAHVLLQMFMLITGLIVTQLQFVFL